MTEAPGETIRQLLNRRDLASARHRAAMSRRLGLSESEMLAVAHLAQHGRLSPSALGQLLDLSSGGITALVQRLEGAGHLVRRRHPTDRRSVLVELSDELVARDRKSTRLNSSHSQISYAVFCLKKKNESHKINCRRCV